MQNSHLTDIYALNLPKWAKDHLWDFYTLAKRAKIDQWRVENNCFVWNKDGVDYFCRNIEDIHRTVATLSCDWNNDNPGWTIQQSVNEEIRQLRIEQQEIKTQLERIQTKIKRLEQFNKK